MVFKKFTYSVGVEVVLTRKQIFHLLTCSDKHYDSECQSASKFGGFVYGWVNKMNDDDTVLVTMDNHQIDILCKITEIEDRVETGIRMNRVLQGLLFRMNDEWNRVNNRNLE